MTQQRPTSELAEIFDAEDRIDAPGGRFNVAKLKRCVQLHWGSKFSWRRFQ
jgi:hypothetical protein